MSVYFRSKTAGRLSNLFTTCVGVLTVAISTVSGAEPGTAIQQSVTFHASFDSGADAEVGRGDRHIYHGTDLSRKVVAEGLPPDGAMSVESGGRVGGYLKFHRRSEAVVFFRAGDNIAYRPENWSGSISMWMRLNPDHDLAPGYVDPLQLTDKDWNNSALFVDFTKDDSPRHFRLGVFSDLAFWNPTQKDWETIAAKDRPMIDVANPPFTADHWTHVVLTWRDFNRRDEQPGEAVLYLNGQSHGPLKGRQQFTWDTAKTVLMLGIYYTGGMDELTAFDRALTAEEVKVLTEQPELIGKSVAGQR